MATSKPTSGTGTQKPKAGTRARTSAKPGAARSDPKSYMNNMKYEIASELGVNLKKGGDMTSREAGYVGGYMVKRMIDQHKKGNK